MRFNGSLLVVLLWTTLSPCTAVAERPTHDGMMVLFGNLHAHSNLSDDTSNVKVAERQRMTPLRAFSQAQAAGLDFLAVSDHQKAVDSGHRLYLTQEEYRTQLYDVALAYNAAHHSAFVAIPAIEWGNTSTGNHINVFGASELPPDSILDAHYDQLLTWAQGNARFAQFNHPDSWERESKRNRAVGNFGEALFPDAAAFAQAARVVATCAVLNSVVGGHLAGKDRHSQARVHRALDPKHLNQWRRLLNLGLHLAPSADQDTHWLNFGSVTAARTAAWVSGPTYDDLIEAFVARRVYATEDDELAVAFQVGVGDHRVWMGGTAGLPAEESDVEVVVFISQGPGVDHDNVDEGPYAVDLYVDGDGPGGLEAARLGGSRMVQGGMEQRFPLTVRRGAYVFLEVRETNGKDNPKGQGDDEVNNATGADGADGVRDDLNDRAVTAPIWFGAPSAPDSTVAVPAPCQESAGRYVWTSSQRSGVYHDRDCWSVKTIGQCNLRYGDVPPEARVHHGCHP